MYHSGLLKGLPRVLTGVQGPASVPFRVQELSSVLVYHSGYELSSVPKCTIKGTRAVKCTCVPFRVRAVKCTCVPFRVKELSSVPKSTIQGRGVVKCT